MAVPIGPSPDDGREIIDLNLMMSTVASKVFEQECFDLHNELTCLK